jgi:hypothetical protein
MKAKTFLLVLPITFLLILSAGKSRAQHPVSDDFCINNTELRLYALVNEYRKQNGLEEIPLSENLCYVAKLHVNDLFYNKPDTSECNLHSWSDKGEWLECCYGHDVFNNTCMTSKPNELTDYPGKGYEIAFWENVDADPEIVLDLWKSSAASRELILNEGRWKGKTWKAFGVGMLKGYAVVWFGTEPDDNEGVKICNTDEIAGKLKKTVTEGMNTENDASVRYYLIISSWKDLARAKSEVKRYKAKGFRNPSVITSGDNFRVSLGNYPTKEKAIAAKKKLNQKYKDIWILKQ